MWGGGVGARTWARPRGPGPAQGPYHMGWGGGMWAGCSVFIPRSRDKIRVDDGVRQGTNKNAERNHLLLSRVDAFIADSIGGRQRQSFQTLENFRNSRQITQTKRSAWKIKNGWTQCVPKDKWSEAAILNFEYWNI